MSSMSEPSGALDEGQPQPAGLGVSRAANEVDLPSGVRVQVRNRFDGAWATGYQVFAAQPDGGYLVRRMSDHSILPITFAAAEMRLDPVPLPSVTYPSSPPAVA